jgi:hypothetical protein
VRTLLSDHGRLAAGAIVGAITAALFAEGLIGGTPGWPAPDERAVFTKDGVRAPEPLPPLPGSTGTSLIAAPPTTTTPTGTTTTTSTTTTTTTKRPTTTTTTTTAAPVTTTTTTRRTTTTTTTTRCGILFC